MTKKLDDAIAKVRELPETDQDLAADLLLSILAEPTPLDDDARSAIQEGLDQARRGEFVPDEEIQALWKRRDR
jgi:predicted transcriptional regulator